ncbi:uncharacterized protein I303_100385 [Kwoniella dejecticola CBS 10117]|uniref:Alternative cyclin Pho80 n=1 Tax=Kwoniella dejecticola CBS 10117 TaxID=1296121 RepID=A0A1A6AEW5_9TREE|nr:alternative cyclin Pho80 [Kwoniella dejecticola CBS 10117]OBR88568.1 alternative cyclin Pho80 [Kwoniella dejecticola CBS 10117]
MSITDPSSSSAAAAGPSREPIIGPPNPQNPPLLPWAFSDCPLDILVDLLTHMLELLIKHNDQVVLTPDALTRFHSRAAPGISVKDYLGRIVKYTNLEKIPLLSLLAYIDTTCNNLPSFTLSSLTVHRFLIASVCAGSKAQCDVFCTNAHYAKVGGIKTGELNALERELLRVTKWDLCCHAEQLQKYYSSLIRSHGGYAQSPQPASPPFLPFPRSRSKPRAAASPTPEGSVPPGEPESPDEDEDDAMGEGEDADAKVVGDGDQGERQEENAHDTMIVDPTGSPENTRGRKRHRERNGSNGNMDVDVDPSPTESQPTDIVEEEGSPYSNASSSVPSSSKSSIHRVGSIGSGSLRGKRRSRLVSISESRIAEPKIDTTPAIISPSNSSHSGNGNAGASGELARRISHSELPHKSAPITNISSGVNAAKSTPAPIPTPAPTRKSLQHAHSHSAISPPSSHSHSHSHDTKSHSHHSGKLLKSLVGGIFRRKSIPGESADIFKQISPSTSTASGNTSLPKGQSKGKAGASVPITGEIPSNQGNRGISNPTPVSGITTSRPISTSPRIPTSTSANTSTSPRMYSPATSATVPQGQSQSQSPKPGLAKPVTPKVRTRDETSLEPKDRVALGAPISLGMGGMGMGLGVGVGMATSDDGKRSRLP